MNTEWITVKEAAKRLKRSTDWVYYLLRNNRLRWLKPGRDYWVFAADVKKFKHQPRGKARIKPSGKKAGRKPRR